MWRLLLVQCEVLGHGLRNSFEWRDKYSHVVHIYISSAPLRAHTTVATTARLMPLERRIMLFVILLSQGILVLVLCALFVRLCEFFQGGEVTLVHLRPHALYPCSSL